MKETMSIVLARIDQKLSDLIASNDKEHKVCNDAMTELTNHVNHENEVIDKRIRILEEISIKAHALSKHNDKIVNRNRKIIYYVVVPILAAVIGGLVCLVW